MIQAAPTTNSTTISNGFEALLTVDERTLWGIISTCALTFLACIYSAIHPNIPSPHDSDLRILWRRFGIMVVALLAPDLIVGWALRQWIWTRHITAQFQECFSLHPKDWSKINERPEAPVAQNKDYTWTRTHSFFLLMGGFMLYVDGKPYQTLSPDHLFYLIRHGSICGPTLTKRQISDRSKGNVISKGSILLQGSWFTLQLLSRTIYHLEPTQFEVGTLAFVVLNFITYTVWWHKPLDVDCPHPVYWKSTKSKPEVYVVSENDDHPMPLELIVVSFCDIFLKILGIDGFSPRKLRAASFDGIHNIKLKRWESNVLTFVGFAIATIFSGIHCTAWFYSFPSHQEQLLWCTSTVTIIIMPWLGFAVGFVLYRWRAKEQDSVKF
ncbi:hypothetical protein DEU56DRAFT_960449 [Suillus clintonianus]|uniref:uncharacterized protein n=1 Tax=Suillus clintonianus TaxID=1904413 RepID=UPI001B86BDDF|nr:uncharacterized protein DEU56DRAFT_960449 [Suillus clintonianus]KAG2151492.1 hypothetical protein DEU56DRAFT_960449 [Suillus clintonianus]